MYVEKTFNIHKFYENNGETCRLYCIQPEDMLK